MLSNSVRPDDRIYAARALSSLGITASDLVSPTLVELLGEEADVNVRFEISKALFNFGMFT